MTGEVRIAPGKGSKAAAISTPLLADDLAACLQQVAHESDRAILVVSTQGLVEFANPFFGEMYGYEPATVAGLQLSALFDAGPTDIGSALWFQWLEEEGRLTSYCQSRGQQPSQRYWTRVLALSVRGRADGPPSRAILFAADVTSGYFRRRVQHPVLESLVRDESVREAMSLVCREIEVLEPSCRLLLWSLEAEETMLLPLARAHGHVAELGEAALDFSRCFPSAERQQLILGRPVQLPSAEGHPLVLRLMLSSLGDETSLHAEQQHWAYPIRSAEGQLLGVLSCSGNGVWDGDSFVARMIGICHQMLVLTLERHVGQKKLEQLAFFDALTGLPNRRQLGLLAEPVLAQATRERGLLAVLIMDVDRLKQVNDSLGYGAGDSVLRGMAQRLRRFGTRAVSAKFSGDEFAMVVRISGQRHLLRLVQRLQQALSQPLDIEGMRLEPSVSMGVSVFPSDGSDIETLLHRADVALHQVKEEGVGRYGFFDRDMRQAQHGRLLMETAFRSALKAGQLQLYYQPQVRLDSGALYGVEALIRWLHPEWGILGPDRFIPLAEEQGLMEQLGHWVIEEAMRQLRDWRDRGIGVPAVSVNMSASNLRSVALPGFVAKSLEAYGLTGADIRIEVTESAALASDESTAAVIESLNEMGLRLSMDDFGTGYSMWDRLRRLPLGEIKLDKRFVQASDDAISQILSQAAVNLGAALNAEVIGEGVESPAHLEALRAQGFDVVQGYLIGRPMPAPAFEAWLNEPPSIIPPS